MILLRDLTAVEKPHLKTGTREQKIVRQTTCLTIIHNFLCDLSVRPFCATFVYELFVRTVCTNYNKNSTIACGYQPKKVIHESISAAKIIPRLGTIVSRKPTVRLAGSFT